jgi:hypothetical protein
MDSLFCSVGIKTIMWFNCVGLICFGYVIMIEMGVPGLYNFTYPFYNWQVAATILVG